MAPENEGQRHQQKEKTETEVGKENANKPFSIKGGATGRKRN